MFVNDKKGGFSEHAMDPMLVASKQSHGVVTLDANMDGWAVVDWWIWTRVCGGEGSY